MTVDLVYTVGCQPIKFHPVKKKKESNKTRLNYKKKEKKGKRKKEKYYTALLCFD